MPVLRSVLVGLLLLWKLDGAVQHPLADNVLYCDLFFTIITVLVKELIIGA